MADEPEIRTGFHRQRRSLLGISLLLGFFMQAGLKVEKLSVFGNDIPIGDPTVAERFLWIGWLYFLVRFLQYAHDLPSLGIVDAYNQTIHHLVRGTAVRLHQTRWENAVNAQRGGSLTIRLDSVDVMQAHSRFWSVRVHRSVAYIDRTGDTIAQPESEESVAVGGLRLNVQRVRAAVEVAVKTRLATEYVLPLVVAAFPVAEKLCA